MAKKTKHGSAFQPKGEQPSQSPDDLKQPFMLKALLDSQQGSGQRMPQMKPGKFTQRYWKKNSSHPDYYSGDPFGTTGKDGK